MDVAYYVYIALNSHTRGLFFRTPQTPLAMALHYLVFSLRFQFTSDINHVIYWLKEGAGATAGRWCGREGDRGGGGGGG